jgi:hypothetical protein
LFGSDDSGRIMNVVVSCTTTMQHACMIIFLVAVTHTTNSSSFTDSVVTTFMASGSGRAHLIGVCSNDSPEALTNILDLTTRGGQMMTMSRYATPSN